jgi:hypothetical protein
MPIRRSLAGRSKVFPGISALSHIAAQESNDDATRPKKSDSWLNRLVKAFVGLGELWQKVNGNVFAYLCFLSIFSIVVRNTQGGDDNMYLMAQAVIGQAEGGFDSTDHTVFPVTGKKNFGVRDIGNLDDLWEWLNPGQFVGVFFPESWCDH